MSKELSKVEVMAAIEECSHGFRYVPFPGAPIGGPHFALVKPETAHLLAKAAGLWLVSELEGRVR